MVTVAELIEQLGNLPAGAVVGAATHCCGCSGTDVVIEHDLEDGYVWVVDTSRTEEYEQGWRDAAGTILRREASADERQAMDELTSLTEDMGLYNTGKGEER